MRSAPFPARFECGLSFRLILIYNFCLSVSVSLCLSACVCLSLSLSPPKTTTTTTNKQKTNQKKQGKTWKGILFICSDCEQRSDTQLFGGGTAAWWFTRSHGRMIHPFSWAFISTRPFCRLQLNKPNLAFSLSHDTPSPSSLGMTSGQYIT